MTKGTACVAAKWLSWGFAILILIATTGPGCADEWILFPTLGTNARHKATLLAIDDYCLPLKKDLCYYLSKPKVRGEAVLTPSRDKPNAPDHVAAHFYGTVLHDGGRFRMWYYSLSWKDRPGQFREGPICYAESADGLHWTKPKLGQVLFKGSFDNNAIALPEESTEGAFVIKDEDERDSRCRYKMVYENLPSHRKHMSVRTATSPDGLHWTPGPEVPIHEGLEPCAFYKHNGLFIINAQFAPSGISEGGHKAGRQGFVWISTDFRDWLQEGGESFTLSEPADPKERGLDKPYVQVHLGVAPVSLGNVLVGPYCIWHARPKPGDWFGMGSTFGDWGLVVSHDGQHFQEPVKGHVYLDRRESPAKLPPSIHHEDVLCQGNGILNLDDKTLIYHGRWANAERDEDYYAEVGLAELPRDRWGALGLFPHASEGSVWSVPVMLAQAKCTLSLNADGVRGMRVEVADERFRLLPEYSGENAGTSASGDGLDCPVKFSKASLATLAGKSVRLRVHLKKGPQPEPRLYAVYVSCK
jgi:hypothetical protein